MSTLVTCLVRFEIGFELCESDCVLMSLSLSLFPNDSFHLLGFFVTVGVDGMNLFPFLHPFGHLHVMDARALPL